MAIWDIVTELFLTENGGGQNFEFLKLTPGS
jgi:hypothetical protein